MADQISKMAATIIGSTFNQNISRNMGKRVFRVWKGTYETFIPEISRLASWLIDDFFTSRLVFSVTGHKKARYVPNGKSFNCTKGNSSKRLEKRQILPMVSFFPILGAVIFGPIY